MPKESVDEALISDIFSGSGSAMPSPFSSALEYVERHLVALSNDQAQALSYLEVLGGKEKRYDSIIQAVLRYRSLTGDVDAVIRAIEAIALYNKFAGITASVSRQKSV